MHPLLTSQLSQVNIDISNNKIDDSTLDTLLTLISNSYHQNDSTKQYLNSILYVMPKLTFLIDAKGKYIDILAKGKENLLFPPREELIGKHLSDIFDPNTSKLFLSTIQKAIKTQTLQKLEYSLEISNKIEYFKLRAFATEMMVDKEPIVMLISTKITDIKEKNKISRLIKTVFEEATEGIIIENSNRLVIQVNQSASNILGMSQQELIGKHSTFLSTMVPEEIQLDIHEKMVTQGVWQGEVDITSQKGKLIHAWLTIDAIMDESHQELQNIVIMITNISDLHKSKEKLEYTAKYDHLTGIANRNLLLEHLQHSIGRMERLQQSCALFFIDIDYFKDINDHYGHQTGDQLLVKIAKRLQNICKLNHTIGRLSGDEFLLIAENINTQKEILTIAKHIQSEINKPIYIENTTFHINTSIGISSYPKNGTEIKALLNAADQAMYSVKKSGRNNYAFFSNKMSIKHKRLYKLQMSLNEAIRTKEFSLVYQPQFSLKDNSLTGLEVLLRCTKEDLINIPIFYLIEIAEESGIIKNISRIVLDLIAQQINRWNALSLKIPKIAINLSRKELGEVDLIEMIKQSQKTCDTNSILFEIEMTESALLQNNHIVKGNIYKLHQMGYTLAIDDYGTGFSSLSNIKEFHFDKLKIDRTFIKDIEDDEDDKIIVSATITMAKKLGLITLAEGIETKGQLDILKQFGCDEVQGFYYSKPLNEKDATTLLLNKKAKLTEDFC